MAVRSQYIAMAARDLVMPYLVALPLMALPGLAGATLTEDELASVQDRVSALLGSLSAFQSIPEGSVVDATDALRFAVTLPKVIDSGLLDPPAKTIGDVPVASTVRWEIEQVDDSGSPTALLEGVDYQIVSGGRFENQIAILLTNLRFPEPPTDQDSQVDPPPPRTIRIRPIVEMTVTIAVGLAPDSTEASPPFDSVLREQSALPPDDSTATPESQLDSELVPVTYQPEWQTELTQMWFNSAGALAERVRQLLRLRINATRLGPGQVLTAAVVPAQDLSVLRRIENISDELPEVNLNASIYLGEPIEAVAEVVRKLISSLNPLQAVQGVPGIGPLNRAQKTATNLANTVIDDVIDITQDAARVPIEGELSGRRSVTNLVPANPVSAPNWDIAEAPMGQPIGSVPVSALQQVLTLADVTWTYPGNSAVFTSPDALVQQLLLPPKLSTASTSGVADSDIDPYRLEVTLTLEAGDQQFDVELGPVDFEQLPIALPRLAFVQKHSFLDVDPLRSSSSEAQQVMHIFTDPQGSQTIGSLSQALETLRQLSVMLQVLTGAVSTGGILQPPPGTGNDGQAPVWDTLFGVQQILSLIMSSVNATRTDNIFFSAIYRNDTYFPLAHGLQNQASAISVIGAPPWRQYFAFRVGSERRCLRLLPEAQDTGGVVLSLNGDVDVPVGRRDALRRVPELLVIEYILDDNEPNFNDALVEVGFGTLCTPPQ